MLKDKCEICGSDSVVYEHKSFSFPIIRCKRCGFIKASETPNEKVLLEFYKTYSYQIEQEIDPITKKRYLEILKKIEKYRKNNKILDFGCGQGHFLEVANEKKWDVFGTEYSEKARMILKEKKIQSINEYELNNFNSQFDAIICIEVIEHVINPVKTIALFHSLLRPGGCLYMTTPNIKNISIKLMSNKEMFIAYTEHLNYFTIKSIKNLLKEKFRIGSLWTTGILPIYGVRKSNKNTEELSNYIDFYKEKFEKRKHLKYIKYFVNIILKITKKGDTIKIIAVK